MTLCVLYFQYFQKDMPARFESDPEEVMNLAYPTSLLDRNVTGGRAMMCSVLPLTIGNDRGMGDVGYGQISDV